MKKCIFVLLICCFFWQNLSARKDTAPGPIVSKVVISGLKNVKEKVVLGQLKTKKNQPYDENVVRQDINRIMELNYFNSVSVSVDTVTYLVNFTVSEKPLVKKILFKGNKKFSKGKLLDNILFKENEYLDTPRIKESEDKIVGLYREEGYADCSVESYLAVNEETNLAEVSFLITEGKQLRVGKVIVSGPVDFRPKKIAGLLKLKKKSIYKQSELDEGIKAVKDFYQNRGYEEVIISSPVLTVDREKGEVDIFFQVQEGRRYTVGQVSFSGNTVIPEKELKELVRIKSKKVYQEKTLQETKVNILGAYADRGYLQAQVVADLKHLPLKDKNQGVIDVQFNITEGPLLYVGNIYIEGLTFTKEDVIRREILLKEGEPFRADRLRRSIERLYNLGFLDGVEPRISPTAEYDVCDLLLNITEGKPGMLSAGAGYSSQDQLYGMLQIQHLNLLGRAQRLNLSWEFGSRRQNYDISWTEPWFLNKPVSLQLRLFNLERLRDYGTVYSAYKETRKGGSAGVGPRIREYLNLYFTYTYEDVEISDIYSTLTGIILPTRDITSSVNSQIVWDSRDNIFDASKGNRQSFALEVAGGPFGGNINYLKTVARSSWFWPSFWKFVFSLNGQFAWIKSFPPSVDVPIYEKFYVGGGESVRGYKYRGEIGPVEGGRVMFVGNVEYKFPIVQENNRTILQGALFWDIGGAWRDFSEVNFGIGSADDLLHTGVGFGIRFVTPVFPLRLDWGYGLNHKPGEELSQFYFTIGSMF